MRDRISFLLVWFGLVRFGLVWLDAMQRVEERTEFLCVCLCACVCLSVREREREVSECNDAPGVRKSVMSNGSLWNSCAKRAADHGSERQC